MIWILPLAALIIGLTLQRRGTGGTITGTGGAGPAPVDPLLDLLRRATGTPAPAPAPSPVPYTPPGGAIPETVPGTVAPSPDVSRVLAQGLRDYYHSGGRDTNIIRQAQTLMGGITADGIVGPQTRARARALGVDWPEPTTTTGTPAPVPAPISYSARDLQQGAAQRLRDYYLGGGRDTATIRAGQTAMGGLTVDGLVGPQTRARARALNVNWEEPSSTGTSTGTPSTSTPTTALGTDIARGTAQRLRDYYNGGGRDATTIRGMQGSMGGITADGLVGPQTRGRARALGVDWPEPSGTGTPGTLPTVAPGSIPTTPIETGLAQGAAQRVRDYYQGGGRDRATIQQAQWAMGGITADGLVGPQTRARARALGVAWPD